MTSLPQDVRDAVESALGLRVLGTHSVSGGCIAHATRLDTTAGPLFLKWQSADNAEVLEAEAAGLRLLHGADHELLIPDVYFLGRVASGRAAVLVMDWIEQGPATESFWERFGRDLATLHRNGAERFGFDHSNFIGRLPQSNAWRQEWPDFFLTQRLQPQVEHARGAGRWQREWDQPYDRLVRDLPHVLPTRPVVSILHGDLWSGNYLPVHDGRAALVDPAVYFGDRETDLAMTELFGGFNARFYQTYREAWPSEEGYEERREIYNLYHLLNHLNHFGSSYASGVARVFAGRRSI